jgi:hypothetical protein
LLLGFVIHFSNQTCQSTVMAAELVDAARNKDGAKPERLRLAI